MRTGFTLVEVLVVTAILAILLGIALTVFASAKGEAKESVCLNNLSQIGKAFQLYADDYDEQLPPYSTRVLCSDPDGLTANPGQLKASLMPYIKDKEVWYCPGDVNKKTANDIGCGENNLHMSYEYDMAVFALGQRGVPYMKLSWSEVKRPSSAGLIGDKLVGRAMEAKRAHGDQTCTVFFDLHAKCIYDAEVMRLRQEAMAER